MSDDDLLILLVLVGAVYYYHYHVKGVPTTTHPAQQQQQQQQQQASAKEAKRQYAERIDVRRKLASQPDKPKVPRAPAHQLPQFSHWKDLDQHGGDILHLPEYANAQGNGIKILELKRICTARSDCKAFNTEGYLKRGSKAHGGGVYMRPKAGVDTYVRS